MFSWLFSWLRKSSISNEVSTVRPSLRNIDNDLCIDSKVDEPHSPDLILEDLKNNITPEIVELIEKDLSDYEIVSLVFLLDDVTDHALQSLKIGFVNGIFQSTAISEWARSEEKNWRLKLLEALLIIENYEVLEKIGYSKNDVQSYFLMYSKGTKYVDSIKKQLFTICESFELSDVEQFNLLVKQGMELKSDKNVQVLWTNEESKFLEILFLQMLSHKYIINQNEYIDLKKLNAILKKMDKLDKADELDDIVREVRSQRLEELSKKTRNSKYPIHNKDDVGLFIVINQVKFKKSSSNSIQLEDRVGSDSDVKALEKTFKENLKMKFLVHDNLRSFEILPTIEESLKDFKYSMVFLCILSHGNSGCIYGTDCKSVPIKSVEDCLTESKFLPEGIPKVLIIQACQDEMGSDLATDGVSNQRDFLKCMATLPGLTAIRHKIEGSWYIQSLCEAIDEYKSEHHLDEIITIVNKKILEKFEKNNNIQYSKSSMIPISYSTLTKFLYLKL